MDAASTGLVVAIRSKRGYSATKHDEKQAGGQKTLRCQTGRSYDRNSARNNKVLKAHGIEPVKVSAPQCNCFAERFVREARETLDNLILVGDGQLFRAMRNIEKHHNEQRPHQGLGGDIPCSYDWPDKESPPEDVRCVSTLGGLLKHYHVAKAA